MLDRAQGQVEISSASVDFTQKNGTMFTALAPTTLTLEPGSFTALVGPSGCGKSTLLNLVAGFLAPSLGAVVLDGKAISGPTPDVGVVFQQYALFPWFTAQGNVEFALKRLASDSTTRKKRALDALAEVGLAEHADKYPGQLSGGMKQRVAIARIFAASPKVILMDEPFGALDALTRISMHRLLLDIWQRHKITVLFVTHDIDEALFLADRVHVMAKGPGRVIETLDIADPRPRKQETRSAELLSARARILDLLLADEGH